MDADRGKCNKRCIGGAEVNIHTVCTHHCTTLRETKRDDTNATHIAKCCLKIEALRVARYLLHGPVIQSSYEDSCAIETFV